MQRLGSVEELQNASEYWLMRRTLRPTGIGSIVFGVIALFMGASSMGENSVNAVLALIGVFLLVEGIWILVAPSPGGMVADGIALILVGCWNVFVWVLSSGRSEFFIILGIWQIVWGVERFSRYRRFSRVPLEKPSEQVMKWLDENVKALASARSLPESDILEFRATARWRAKLFEDAALFVFGSGQDVLLARKDHITFSCNGEPILNGKSLKATFGIGDRNLSGTISVEAFAKYGGWKGEGALPFRAHG
jgi:hypothetical protein